MTISELMDKAKERASLPSDYALAKAMGIDRAIISRWRKGKQHPSTDEAVQLATLAGLDEMRVIAEIELLTAKTEKKQSFWKCYLEQRGITAALCLIAVGASIMLTPSRTDADVLHLQNYGENQSEFSRARKSHNIHYANFRTRQSGTVRGTVSDLTHPRLAVKPPRRAARPACPVLLKVRVRM